MINITWLSLKDFIRYIISHDNITCVLCWYELYYSSGCSLLLEQSDLVLSPLCRKHADNNYTVWPRLLQPRLLQGLDYCRICWPAICTRSNSKYYNLYPNYCRTSIIAGNLYFIVSSLDPAITEVILYVFFLKTRKITIFIVLNATELFRRRLNATPLCFFN